MNKILRYCLTGTLMLLSILPAAGGGRLSNKQMRKLAERMETLYTPWEEVSLKGKFRMEGLPLSPSVRLYMVRDSLIVMSLSAPLIGEAARIELDNDSITLVNKMKHCFTRLPMSALEKFYPGNLTDFQEFLLGRVVICGQGLMSADLVSGLDWYPGDGTDDADLSSGEWMLVPQSQWQPDGARYGYVLYEDLTPESLIVEIDDSDDYVEMDYYYDRGKTTLDMLAAYGRHTLEAQLILDAPADKVQPIKRLTSLAGYNQVPLKQLLKF